jgi:ligand-binding SRPBCC domain-containing protein
MTTVRLKFETTVSATPGEIWDWTTSVRGISSEMRPILKMTFPSGMTHIPENGDSLGKPLCNCKFLLLGILPIDLSRLTFVEVERGRRFVEQSPLLSMKRWRHERVITAAGKGTRVTDLLEFSPRFASPLVKWFITRFFQHRHAVLLRQFG